MRGLLVAAALFSASVAYAAELPSRNATAKAGAPKARECEIGGERGVELPGGTCMRISGYISAGMTGGTLKH